MELNERQQRFADLYIELGNGSEAYRQAGYETANDSVASAASARLLANVKVRKYIDQRLEALSGARVASQQEVMEFLTSVMRGEVDEPAMKGLGGGAQEVVYVKPSAATRKAAAEQLGKRWAMWTDKNQVEVSGQVQILDDLEVDEDE